MISETELRKTRKNFSRQQNKALLELTDLPIKDKMGKKGDELNMKIYTLQIKIDVLDYVLEEL